MDILEFIMFFIILISLAKMNKRLEEQETKIDYIYKWTYRRFGEHKEDDY